MSYTELVQSLHENIDLCCIKSTDNDHRWHLGASMIGEECRRKLWYSFRWCFKEKITGRMARIFDRGHREETRFIWWLEGGSCEVRREAHKEAFRGHFGGTPDAVVFLPKNYGFNVPLLAEFKTHKDNAEFKKLVKEGVKTTKPLHWAQMCVYGHLTGLNHALYMVVNKNTDELHIEVLELDLEHGKAMIEKGGQIIFSEEPPVRASDLSVHQKCVLCAARGICHYNEPLELNCRSCKHATPFDDGSWMCAQKTIDPQNVYDVCDHYFSIK